MTKGIENVRIGDDVIVVTNFLCKRKTITSATVIGKGGKYLHINKPPYKAAISDLRDYADTSSNVNIFLDYDGYLQAEEKTKLIKFVKEYFDSYENIKEIPLFRLKNIVKEIKQSIKK